MSRLTVSTGMSLTEAVTMVDLHGRGHEVTRTSDEVNRGHLTDDSGVDSITVSPTREAGGMMETLLTMAMTGEKMLVMSEIDICGQQQTPNNAS